MDGVSSVRAKAVTFMLSNILGTEGGGRGRGGVYPSVWFSQ